MKWLKLARRFFGSWRQLQLARRRALPRQPCIRSLAAAPERPAVLSIWCCHKQTFVARYRGLDDPAIIRQIGDNLCSHRKLERARRKLALQRRLGRSPDLKMEPTNLGSKLFGGPHGAILRGKEGRH
jgi:hypothetical protein